jgi:NAD+ diphosphatase
MRHRRDLMQEVSAMSDPFRAPLAFAGSGLDRAAHLRRDPEALARLWVDPRARVLPFWHGRPGFAAAGGLMLVAPGHPVLAEAPGAALFLGREDDGAPRFAADLALWQPAEGAPDPKLFLDARLLAHPDLPEGAGFAELRLRLTELTAREAELAATARALFEWHRTHRFCARCGQPGDLAEAGWTRRCPACGALHFPRTDPVAIMLVTRGERVLLGRSPGWPEGMFSCLAGFMEPGETLEDAVRREVAEETGVQVGAVRYVGSQPWPFPASLMLGCRAEALSDDIRPDPTEIEDALWVSRSRLAAIFAGTDPVIRAPRRGAIAGWLLRLWLADRLE